ncbi:hypothetical protein L6164_033074 [Bauhinia variegata]|uniref:Uncharacterized protein n=1 Tax=Bauhinia variegata TaxID=167791 RepID=A0ACB9KRH8_BAUVA|nr:hypothetical protein L6164_033074 [Bauhinia variegata]
MWCVESVDALMKHLRCLRYCLNANVDSRNTSIVGLAGPDKRLETFDAFMHFLVARSYMHRLSSQGRELMKYDAQIDKTSWNKKQYHLYFLAIRFKSFRTY